MGGSPLDSHEKGKWPKIVRQLQGWKNTHNFPSPSFESDGGGTLIFGPPKTPLKKTGVYSGPWEMERFFVCLFFLKIGLSVWRFNKRNILPQNWRKSSIPARVCQELPPPRGGVVFAGNLERVTHSFNFNGSEPVTGTSSYIWIFLFRNFLSIKNLEMVGLN